MLSTPAARRARSKLIVKRQVLFFNVPRTTEIYTLSLHDALPISQSRWRDEAQSRGISIEVHTSLRAVPAVAGRSEEHTSELQSLTNLVCRLLLEKKK